MGKSSVKDVAKLSGVSLGTVDRVLNKRGNVSAKALKAVEDAIIELNYVPNIAARMLANPKRFTIATVLPISLEENGYWHKQGEGIRTAARELEDIGITIVEYRYQLTSIEDFIIKSDEALEAEVDAILTAPIFADATKRFAAQCEKLNIPLCYMDSLPESELHVSFNGMSPRRSARAAAELIDFGMDLEREQVLCLAVLLKGEGTSNIEQRQAGFTKYFSDIKKSHAVVHGVIIIDGTEEKQLDDILEEENIKGIFVLNSRSFAIAPMLKKDILLIGYDLLPENIKHLRSGKIKYLVNTQSAKQSFKGIMKLSRILTGRERTNSINYFPTTFVSRENIEDTLEEIKQHAKT
ncbi:MAG: LacI family DNA-binding transcriptional regulator [Flavobacteriales bacterium]|nr:LacI family DNA-binding transcriptional regulator [Flavobacteriales bacterium]